MIADWEIVPHNPQSERHNPTSLMLRSMTAFAREQADTEWGQCIWELRSVNHRYLETTLRLPDDFRGLEQVVRERLNQALKRGKVECSLRVKNSTGGPAELRLNLPLAEQIIEAAQSLQQRIDHPAPLQALEILRWPGVLSSAEPDLERLSVTLLALLDRALQQLLAHRAREGAQIGELLLARCAAIAEEVRQVRGWLPEILDNQRARLRARLAELGNNSLDHERLDQEILLLAQKMDVAEELDRINTHLDEIRQALQATQEPVGRRLDFLMQELNREANTLGSKSIHANTSQASIRLKVLIEQMREQVQNLE
jgi:uncharacterized protein (TIGR00255 family)